MTKERQAPGWTDPCAFFSTGEAGQLGITFAAPIIRKRKETKGRRVFHGVLAVDYYLTEISDFLTSQYNNTETMVMVVEKVEPNFIVAASTGKDPSKLVFRANESLACTLTDVEDINRECHRVRIRVQEMAKSDSDLDKIFALAFEAQRAASFPSSEKYVKITVSDQVGGRGYTSQGGFFSTQNIEWHVIVIFPLSRDPSDSAGAGSAAFAIAIVLGVAGFVVTSLLGMIFYSHRRERAVINSDWRLTCLYLAGCALLNLSSLTMVGENTDFTCNLRAWTMNALFVCGEFFELSDCSRTV